MKVQFVVSLLPLLAIFGLADAKQPSSEHKMPPLSLLKRKGSPFISSGPLSMSPSRSSSVNNTPVVSDVLSKFRGGGPQNAIFDTDSNLVIFAKVGFGAALETVAMLGILKGTQQLAKRVFKSAPILSGLSLVQWAGLFVIAYASSFLGSIVEGGVNAASNQLLDPNVVPSSPEWYDRLEKPSWNPPGWVFPIMWLIVSKPTQMVAVSKLLQATGEKSFPWTELSIYCTHLALGDAWNKIFFGMQFIGKGVIVITTFYALLLTSALKFYEVDSSAGLFLLPTCGWVTIATALNWSIFLKNRKK